MAYFANGAEGRDYMERWCFRCENFDEETMGCPVTDAHLLVNYDQCENEKLKTALAALIPMDKNGLYPAKCSMFRWNGVPVGQTELEYSQ